MPANDNLGAFGATNLHVAIDVLRLRPIDQRSDVDRWIEAVADFQLLDARRVTFQKLTVHLLVDHHTTGRGATLARSAEATPYAAIYGQLEVAVCHDHHHVLAAHLQAARASGCRTGLRDDPTHL